MAGDLLGFVDEPAAAHRVPGRPGRVDEQWPEMLPHR